MRSIANVAIILGFLSLVVGIISRLRMMPIYAVRGGLEAQSLLLFAMVCFIVAITFILLELADSKK